MGTNITPAQAAEICTLSTEETERIIAFRKKMLRRNNMGKALNIFFFPVWIAFTLMYISYITQNDIIDDFWFLNFPELITFMVRTFAYVTASFILLQYFFHGIGEHTPELLESKGFSGILINSDGNGYAAVLVNNDYIVSGVKINEDITCGKKVITACFDDGTAAVVSEKEN